MFKHMEGTHKLHMFQHMQLFKYRCRILWHLTVCKFFNHDIQAQWRKKTKNAVYDNYRGKVRKKEGQRQKKIGM